MANFQVFVYPNDWALWNDAQTVKEGLEEAADILADHGSIQDYRIDIRLEMPELGSWNAFESWCEDNHDEPGTHFWLTGSYGEGRAQGGDSWRNAWTDPMCAKIHTSTADYHGFKKELSVQECLHPYLWDGAIDDWIENDEHDLGGIQYNDGSWRVTPMACSYTNTHLHHGDCHDFYDYTGYTVEPTYCTKEAMKHCNPAI